MKTNISKKDTKNINKKTSKKDTKKNSKKSSNKESTKRTDSTDKIKWKDDTISSRNIYENIDYKIEPIKVIYKYKNINRKTQYLTYVFLGTLGKKYEKILSKIENLDLLDTLLELTKEEEYKLIEGFGDLWMIKFFNIYHISGFVNKIESKSELRKKLLKKYDEEWLNNFINKFNKQVIYKKVNYSFGDLVKFQYRIKMGKKLEKVLIEKEDIEELNFSTEIKDKKNLLTNLDISQLGGLGEGKYYNEDKIEDYKDVNLVSNNWDNLNNLDYIKMGGGEEEGEDMEEIDEQLSYQENEVDDDDDFDPTNIYPSEIVSENDDEEIIQTAPKVEQVEEEMNYDEIEKLYQTDETDKNINTTNTLISSVLDNSKLVEKKQNYMIKFDDYQDSDIDNENLSNVYIKKFVYTHIIFKDDSIKNLKNKLCAVIKGNERLSPNMYLIPSRMYLWSEYIYNEKIEKIMIGQKWMKKNELLNIDIEPLDISNYDNLSENIKNLRDMMKRYGGKIRREDEENNLLLDYSDYILNDTIYMCDIYNELGHEYKCNQEQLKNISETFFKLYFPKIKSDDIENIIKFLNNEDKKTEEIKIKNSFDTIYNDALLEKEITDLIERIKMNKKKEYSQVFEEGNFITQSVIHVQLDISDPQLEKENKENLGKIGKLGKSNFGSVILPKLDLFRIFNDFEPDYRYPFIQYQIPDGQIIFKYFDEYMAEFSKSGENVEMVTKWFENSPYGISFKIRLVTEKDGQQIEKFMAININDIGKIEYKTQWKEEDNANMNDVINTYDYIKDLVERINKTLENHPRKLSVRKPENYEFRFAFINCIQRFKLPNNKIISHNDLSEFCIYFYPYISLQIEPKKRIGKSTTIDTKSKYGSYLRYKRVSKFDNTAKIEQRILSYMRNFDFEDDILAEEISKQFNITNERALEEIKKVRDKFPNLGKVKKTQLKKTDEVPKFKPPGIGIDIQGKVPEKYKIRISGAREQTQLERIIIFMNVLMYLYSETYINKNPEYQEIKNKLKKLTNIAKRRGKVEEIVNYQKEIKTVKQMAQLDKKRLGFTPEEGQNQWTRSCQNSGNDKKRRPEQTLLGNLPQLLAKGYVLNKKTNQYEKKVKIKSKGKKDMEIILKAIKVLDKDETGQINDIFYTCDPEDNGQHMYVGFLTRSNNPFGECMPCCFKKNKFETKKKETLDFYKQCLGEKKPEDFGKQAASSMGDILYILQDTNKIQEGRLGYLPKYIDLITNIYFEKKKEIKNHYLLKTDSYFFKFGINQENYSFINTIGKVLNTSVDILKNNIVKFLKSDTNEMTYIGLNDGDIRAEYKINDFARFIMESEYIDYYYLKDLLKIPGLFTSKGIFPIIFNKSVTEIKRGLGDDKIKEDFYLVIDKTMIIDYEYCLNMFETHDILFLIKDGKYYYPIVEIIKPDDNIKTIEIKKLFNKNLDKKTNTNSDEPIIDVLKKFYVRTIKDTQTEYPKTHTSARETFALMKEIAKKNPESEIIAQAVDSRFKCKYLLTKENFIIPVIPSGIVGDIPIICFNTLEYSKRQDCFSKISFVNINKSQEYLEKLFKLSNKKLNIKPIGMFYDYISEDNFANIIGLMTTNNDLVPVAKQLIPIKELNANNVNYQHRPLYHELDSKLATYDKNYFEVIDKRIKNVNQVKYLDEAYQLFRFELSNILSDAKYEQTRNKLKKYIAEKKSKEIQELLLNLSVGDIGTELVKIINELPNLDYYKINNQRQICSKLDVNTCLSNPHCTYVEDTKISKIKSKSNNKCLFALEEKYLYEFIKKMSIELCEQEIKVYELLKEKKYFVDDIVDHNNFTEKQGQSVVKSSNTNLQKILTDMFGKEHVPKIGKRFISKKNLNDIQNMLIENPLKDIKDAWTQTIIPQNYSIIRAYVNGYYWIKHKMYTLDTRNLGYYSNTQNELVNLFRSFIVDWLNIPDNIKFLTELSDETKKLISNTIVNLDIKGTKKTIDNQLIINKYIVKLMESNIEDNFGFMELLILNNIHKIPIVIFINGIPKYYINNNIITIKNDNNNNNKYFNSSNINIGLDYNVDYKYPNIIEIIYIK